MTNLTSITGTCSVNKTKFAVTISSYTTIKYGSNTESAMASYVQTTGPLSVCLAADAFQSYRSGILATWSGRINHCVQAVGVSNNGTTAGNYWKFRNQWGASWGEKGFIRLKYGVNLCRLTNDPTYVVPRLLP